jgi:hypothetical protein
MDESLLSFADPVLHAMVPKFPIATNTRLLTSTKNTKNVQCPHLPLVIFWVNISSGQLLRSLRSFLLLWRNLLYSRCFLKWPTLLGLLSISKQWYLQSNEILLNMSIKCYDPRGFFLEISSLLSPKHEIWCCVFLLLCRYLYYMICHLVGHFRKP